MSRHTTGRATSTLPIGTCEDKLIQRWRIRVRGMVQGVGFRPFVWRLARELDLAGWVLNDADGVLIEAEGDESRLGEFYSRLITEAPAISHIAGSEWHLVDPERDVAPESGNRFQIIESRAGSRASVVVSPDLAMCSDCERELHDPSNRRYRYPFINCTNCGPRYSIIRSLPYDRPATTMAAFAMCDECRREYDDPGDRRFHAQPNACARCGPRVWLEDADGTTLSRSDDAVRETGRLIAAGRIVAIKGIGGFHLACDAKNPRAIAELRLRKRRGNKPLAAMVADLDTARSLARITDDEAILLQSVQRPIVLVENTGGLEIGNDRLGLMLTYSPLHALLVGPGDVWVMTSGNVADEPIAIENDVAREKLGRLADALLMHDRGIETVVDDSVVRVVDPGAAPKSKHASARPVRHLMPIRRSRGFAPMPIQRVPISDSQHSRTVLAVGGELKSTLCLLHQNCAIVSQHIGDVGNPETLDHLQRVATHLCRLHQVRPDLIVADLHPGYLSADWAQRYADQHQIPLMRVQHHHAHVASLVAESGIDPAENVLGVCFDGTGYGTDGTIWGGELLWGNVAGVQRIGGLTAWPLPGGDACIRSPARSAIAALSQFGISTTGLSCERAFSKSQLRLLSRQIQRRINCVMTSSAGRLFDAAASIIGLRQQVDYEGQAAMELEVAASSVTGTVSPESLRSSSGTIDTAEILRRVIGTLRETDHPSIAAARFHQDLVSSVASAAMCLRDQFKFDRVLLTGGVFQNALLTRWMTERLEADGFCVHRHRMVPPNDGGLSLGQALVGTASPETRRC
ncbi:MAG: carbamoyltransferase HypF [Planctomycetota bacterium]